MTLWNKKLLIKTFGKDLLCSLTTHVCTMYTSGTGNTNQIDKDAVKFTLFQVVNQVSSYKRSFFFFFYFVSIWEMFL